jgi:hypothetical protein
MWLAVCYEGFNRLQKSEVSHETWQHCTGTILQLQATYSADTIKVIQLLYDIFYIHLHIVNDLASSQKL